MTPERYDIEWFVPRALDEIDADAQRMRAMGVRLLAAAVPTFWLVWGPVRRAIELLNGPMRPTFFLVISAILLAQPLAFLWAAVQIRGHQARAGRRYRLNDRAIRWGEKRVRRWRDLRTFALEHDRNGEPTSITLLGQNDRTTRVTLASDPNLARRTVAYLAARSVPAYRPDVHGSLDVSAALPAWTLAALASLCVIAVAIVRLTHWRDASLTHDSIRLLARLSACAAAIVPIAWYLVVIRPVSNGPQRETATSYAAAAGLATLCFGLCVTLGRPTWDAFETLRRIPPEVRLPMAKTISAPANRRDE